MWVPKNKIIHLEDALKSSKKTSIMVPGQLLLTTHDRRKLYNPKPEVEEGRKGRL